MEKLEAEAFEVWQAIIHTHDKPGDVLEMLAFMLAWTAFAGTKDSGGEINVMVDAVAKMAKMYAAETLRCYQKGELLQ